MKMRTSYTMTMVIVVGKSNRDNTLVVIKKEAPSSSMERVHSTRRRKGNEESVPRTREG